MGIEWLRPAAFFGSILFALIGVVVDQLLFYFQVFTVDGSAALPPVWMFFLWPVLATTVMHAFSALQGRYVLAAVLGGVGGVASFVAGTRMTGVEFASTLFGPAIIAVVWAGSDQARLEATLSTLRQRLAQDPGTITPHD